MFELDLGFLVLTCTYTYFSVKPIIEDEEGTLVNSDSFHGEEDIVTIHFSANPEPLSAKWVIGQTEIMDNRTSHDGKMVASDILELDVSVVILSKYITI